jgi:hypothetical protein
MAAGRGSRAFAVGFALASLPRPAIALPSPFAERGSELAPASGSLTLSLRGGYRADAASGRELVALVELNIPLDRFFAQPPDATRPDDEQAPESEPPAAEEPRPKAPPRKLVVRLTPALARSAVRAALRASGDGESRARLDSIASRARSSAALPELRLGAMHSTDQSLRLSPTQADPYRYTQSGGVDLAFEARLTWKLDRLVFADQELGVERIRSERAAARARLAQQVLRALFEWQRAELKQRDPELTPEEQAEAAVSALEALVTLDVLTGGWFSQHVAPRPASESEERRAESSAD